MLGAIAGDVIGSVYEGATPQPIDFPIISTQSRFTDDSVMTIAVAHAIRTGSDYATALRRWGRRYPHAGYGGWFRHWLIDDTAGPYGSFGNGSAMRVSAVGWAFDDESAVLEQAAASAAVTHNHSEGIKGAQAVALAVLLGRRGDPMPAIRRRLEDDFGFGGVPVALREPVLERLDAPLVAEVEACIDHFRLPLP